MHLMVSFAYIFRKKIYISISCFKNEPEIISSYSIWKKIYSFIAMTDDDSPKENRNSELRFNKLPVNLFTLILNKHAGSTC